VILTFNYVKELNKIFQKIEWFQPANIFFADDIRQKDVVLIAKVDAVHLPVLIEWKIFFRNKTFRQNTVILKCRNKVQ
jgi:hypothetical protein